MLDNQASISKKLLIKSPLHLYSLIKNQESLLERNKAFEVFSFSMLRYLDGCKCDEDLNKKCVETEYQNIKENEQIQDLISKHFKCSGIIFRDENW